MTRLTGKRAIITGAARGIGKAFAEAYVREGARVVITDNDIERAKTEAAETGSSASVVELDVSNQASIEAGSWQGCTLRGMGTADDLTGMAVFPATNDSEYVVAQTYNVDGGQWMS